MSDASSVVYLSNASYWAIAAVLLIGVPHGGLDAAVARRVGWPAGLLPWTLFHLVYLGLAAAVALLWWAYPLPSLTVFLLISALHFGSSDIRHIESPLARCAWLPLIAHGGLVVIAIPALQGAAVEPLFATLVGADNSAWLLNQIDRLLLPWAICLFGYCIYTLYQPRWRGPLFGLLLLVVAAWWLPPLVSFALYFCLWHSRSHMLRIWRSINAEQRPRSAWEAVIYSLLAYAAAAIYFIIQTDSDAASVSTITPALLQLTFIGLAALTVPHMLLVDFIHGQRDSPHDQHQ
jgi:Brp/Blh family beta-carotene 15,15'-monooxygenase